ncbi:hypothetical protein UCRPA7_4986 [Phaeoacremonium minimum UCRPA7]|uniref:Uncharacterized protein n=1 Tax=Phaeoacremonium minimum (strain UCR-PA7) TaxID=1286976 RepID=R8BJK9_PHAM7|nr:hypothetical protein UCRPA7_4986 [Phaeoacremonium minimum UCRPA7]EON99501.1 hypothetical protein UCRPA7_4986 [Phaeoacremonium minimum UCRPA7]
MGGPKTPAPSNPGDVVIGNGVIQVAGLCHPDDDLAARKALLTHATNMRIKLFCVRSIVSATIVGIFWFGGIESLVRDYLLRKSTLDFLPCPHFVARATEI